MLSMEKYHAGDIRPADRSETTEISSLIAAAFEPFRGNAPTEALRLYIENSCNIDERWDKGQVLVLDHNGRIVATVTYYADATLEGLGWPHGFAGFRTLAVHPQARSHGFGRRLVDRCIDNARRDGAKAVGIHSAAFMERACGMYERAGFVRCPQYDIYASSILGFDRSLGDELVIAYQLPLPES
ncbi:GNAT family N-acetyltransferase [Mesorhizobium sp. CN2-181]